MKKNGAVGKCDGKLRADITANAGEVWTVDDAQRGGVDAVEEVGIGSYDEGGKVGGEVETLGLRDGDARDDRQRVGRDDVDLAKLAIGNEDDVVVAVVESRGGHSAGVRLGNAAVGPGFGAGVPRDAPLHASTCGGGGAMTATAVVAVCVSVPEVAVNVKVYVPAARVGSVENWSALAIDADVVTEHGLCTQEKPVIPATVMTTGEAKPLLGVMVKL